MSPENGFEYFRAGGEEYGDKEDSVHGNEHKYLKALHNGYGRVRVF